MIARYTRPELAEIWSDRTRFEAMREVEVAACEEMEGPTADELEAIRSASFTVAAIGLDWGSAGAVAAPGRAAIGPSPPER